MLELRVYASTLHNLTETNLDALREVLQRAILHVENTHVLTAPIISVEWRREGWVAQHISARSINVLEPLEQRKALAGAIRAAIHVWFERIQENDEEIFFVEAFVAGRKNEEIVCCSDFDQVPDAPSL